MPVQYPKMVATWAASDSERPVKRPSPQAMVNARIAVSMLRDAARQCGVLSTMERDSYVMAIHDVLDTIDPPQ
jgi:hypothetical protein